MKDVIPMSRFAAKRNLPGYRREANVQRRFLASLEMTRYIITYNCVGFKN
jgi:hypothetical protein